MHFASEFRAALFLDALGSSLYDRITRLRAGARDEAKHPPPFLIFNGAQDWLSRRIAVIIYNPIVRNA